MRKLTWIIAAVALAAIVPTAGPSFATKPDPDAGGFIESGHKVTICHRTGSASNPYVVITVDIAAIDGGGDDDHSGHEQVGNGLGGDVIPPIPGIDSGDGLGAGKNWSSNWTPGASKQDIERNDSCQHAPS